MTITNTLDTLSHQIHRSFERCQINKSNLYYCRKVDNFIAHSTVAKVCSIIFFPLTFIAYLFAKALDRFYPRLYVEHFVQSDARDLSYLSKNERQLLREIANHSNSLSDILSSEEVLKRFSNAELSFIRTCSSLDIGLFKIPSLVAKALHNAKYVQRNQNTLDDIIPRRIRSILDKVKESVGDEKTFYTWWRSFSWPSLGVQSEAIHPTAKNQINEASKIPTNTSPTQEIINSVKNKILSILYSETSRGIKASSNNPYPFSTYYFITVSSEKSLPLSGDFSKDIGTLYALFNDASTKAWESSRFMSVLKPLLSGYPHRPLLKDAQAILRQDPLLQSPVKNTDTDFLQKLKDIYESFLVYMPYLTQLQTDFHRSHGPVHMSRSGNKDKRCILHSSEIEKIGVDKAQIKFFSHIRSLQAHRKEFDLELNFILQFLLSQGGLFEFNLNLMSLCEPFSEPCPAEYFQFKTVDKSQSLIEDIDENTVRITHSLKYDISFSLDDNQSLPCGNVPVEFSYLLTKKNPKARFPEWNVKVEEPVFKSFTFASSINAEMLKVRHWKSRPGIDYGDDLEAQPDN